LEHDSFFPAQHSLKGDHHAAVELEREQYVPPWTEPYVIGVAGPSGSGKTSVAASIIQEINTPWTVLLSVDNFYKPLGPEDRQKAFNNDYDFDSLESVDLDYCYECVKSLRAGHKTQIPIYSFAKHDREKDRFLTIYGANVIVIEGIYALAHEKLRDLMHLKIYVDTDLDVCLARRLNRDIAQRGRDLAGAIQQWNRFVKPNAEKHVKPTMSHADLIVPRGSDNVIAIDMLIKHIKRQLNLKSEAHLQKIEKLTGKLSLTTENYPNLRILEKTNQTRGIYTILLNHDTPMDDFIFYFDRIATKLINKALESCSDYAPTTIITPLGTSMDTIVPISNIIAVNIIRSGDCFMHSLRKTIPEIAIGKVLIQSDVTTGEPQLHAEALPPGISSPGNKVLLLDAQVISGAGLIMAIQVLVDHGVQPRDIVAVTYIAAEIGISRIMRAFKDVTVVVGEVGYRENIISEPWFRKRFIDTEYFGT
jgi:uridine kinase